MIETGFSKGRFFSKKRALMPGDLIDRRRHKAYRASRIERYIIDVDFYRLKGQLQRVEAS